MLTVLSYINLIVEYCFVYLYDPLASRFPFVTLLIFTAFISGVMLIIFKKTSNQKALEKTKDLIWASLFEMRLYNHSFSRILRAQLNVFKANGKYLLYSLPPMIFIIPILLLLLPHLDSRYGYLSGKKLTLEVVLKDGWEAAGIELDPATGKPEISLVLPEGIRQGTPWVWVARSNTLFTRVEFEREGVFGLKIKLGPYEIDKSISYLPNKYAVLSTVKPGLYVGQMLLYASEFPIEKNVPVRFVKVHYEPKYIPLLEFGDRSSLFGGYFYLFSTHWLIVFFVWTIVFIIVLRKPLGVVI